MLLSFKNTISYVSNIIRFNLLTLITSLIYSCIYLDIHYRNVFKKIIIIIYIYMVRRKFGLGVLELIFNSYFLRGKEVSLSVILATR